MASQILRVPFLTTSLFYVPDILLAIAMVVTALAFGNPWYNRGKKARPEEAPHMVTVP
jgi:hypothetical protein